MALACAIGALTAQGGDPQTAGPAPLPAGALVRLGGGPPRYRVGFGVLEVAAGDDGIVAVAGNFAGVVLIDARTGTEPRRLAGFDDLKDRGVFAIAFGPKGLLAMAVGGSVLRAPKAPSVRLFDARTGAELRRFPTDGTADSVAISRDGKYVAASGGAIRVWEAQSGREVRTIGGATFGSVAFSDDGSSVMGASDAFVGVYELPSGRSLRRLPGRPRSRAAFRPRTSSVAIWDDDGLRYEDAVAPAFAIAEGGVGAPALAFAPDGKTVAVSSGETPEVRILDAENGAELRRLDGRWVNGSATTLSFSRDGTLLAAFEGGSGPCDPRLRVFDVATGRLLETAGHAGAVSALEFSPDGSIVASSANSALDATVRLWDAAKGVELRRLAGGGALALAFSPDGARLAAGGQGLRLAQVATAAEIRTTPLRGEYVLGVAFSPDGSLLSAATTDVPFRTWDETGFGVVKSRRAEVVAVAPTPDGSGLLTSESMSAPVIHAWRASAASPTAEIAGVCSMRLAASSGGRALLSLPPGSRAGGRQHGADTVVCLDGATGALRWTFAAPPRVRKRHLLPLPWPGRETAYAPLFSAVAFSRDGRRAAAGDEDGYVYLLDAASGKPLATFEGDAEITALAFAPDGARLASGDEGGGITIWNARK